MKKKVLLGVLVLTLIFGLMGCEDDDGGKKKETIEPIGEITITNLPANIPVDGKDGTSNPAFKIYLNASDSQSESELPVAYGLAKFSEETLTDDGKYSIKIQLRKPNSPGTDPNTTTEPWTGTAKYFSVAICPENLNGEGINAIIVKGSMTPLNKGKETCSWDSLLDLRKMDMISKIQALYDGIIVNDNEITK